MELLADYFSALGRGVVSVCVFLGRSVLRLLLLAAWLFALFGVLYSYFRVSVVVGAILTVVFLLGSGFVLFVLARRYPAEEIADDRDALKIDWFLHVPAEEAKPHVAEFAPLAARCDARRRAAFAKRAAELDPDSRR